MVNKIKRSVYLAGSLLALWGMVVMAIPGSASAAQITSRSLTLQAGTTAGGSDPGGVVNHNLTFTLASTTSISSIQFLYCTTADGTCSTPTGLLTTSATLGSSTSLTGFTINVASNGAPYITTSTAYTPSTSTPVDVQIDGVTNPTTTNQTFYVRISTFVATTPTGSAIDTGNVAASTATPILLSGQMPESLVFCTGGTISTTSGVPDCTTATSGAVSFTSLFSPTATATATSQMAASTNAGTGFVITINGATLTSGSNTITAMSTSTTSTLGVSQFGLNLVVNTTPAVGTAITPTSNGSSYKGEALVGYNTANYFKFNTGDSIADSKNGGAGGTDAQIYTSAYIVNVPGNQPAGTYTSTLTYICTPTF